VEGSEPEIEATAGLIGADRICISTDYPHFDSNFPHVAENLLKNVPREIAAQIFMGGAHPTTSARSTSEGRTRPGRRALASAAALDGASGVGAVSLRPASRP